MIRKNADAWASLVVLIFAIVFFVTSFQYDYVGDLGPGAGFLPFWLSLLLMVMSVLYLIQAVRKRFVSEDFLPDKPGLRKIGIVLFSLLLFIGIVKVTGIVIATTVLLFLLLMGEFRWYISLAIALLGALVLYIGFVVVFNIPLPVNRFGF